MRYVHKPWTFSRPDVILLVDPSADYLTGVLALMAQLLDRIDRLTARVDDLEQWVGELGDDLTDHTEGHKDV